MKLFTTKKTLESPYYTPNTMYNLKKTNTLNSGRRFIMAALTGLILIFSSYDAVQAQFQIVEDLLNSGSIGGTRGYRLRRIGSNAAAGSLNSNYVYYPASSIKILQAYWAMSEVDDGSWSLFGTNLTVCTDPNENCSATLNSSVGCNPVNENLSTVITGMMVNSSNHRTNAVQEQAGIDFWPAGAPFNNNRAHYGRISMTNFAQNTLNMSNTSLNHKFGCAGACEPVPNTLSLRDIDRCYSNIAWNTAIMSANNRMELYNRVPNSTNWLNTIVDEEAADLNKQTHAAAFKAQMYSMNKGGSWSCSGQGYYNNSGLVQLPTYNGAFKRLFVWGTFIDSTDPNFYLGGNHSAANRELLRYAVRGALLTWSLPWHPGGSLGSITTGVQNAQQGVSSSSLEGYYLSLAMNHLANAGGVVNDSIPPKKEILEEMEQAAIYINNANSIMGDPMLDSIIFWMADTGVEIAEDVMALAVSTGDGSRLERGLSATAGHLADAKKSFDRGSYLYTLRYCVEAAKDGEPLINNANIDAVQNTPSIGFFATSTGNKNAFVPEELQTELVAAPNPFTNEIKIGINATQDGTADLRIYDMQGREVAQLFQGEVKNGKQYSMSWTAQDMPGGLYFARLVTEKGVQNIKIVLQR